MHYILIKVSIYYYAEDYALPLPIQQYTKKYAIYFFNMCFLVLIIAYQKVTKIT